MFQAAQDAERFTACCVCLDLEVGKADRQIHQIGAVRRDAHSGEPRIMHYSHGPLSPALAQLDEFASGAEFTVGHNIIGFDLPFLAAAKPDLKLLERPAVDTLWLNPLAFPRNPYHHLVKHYQDAKLRSGQKNNPAEDARLTLDVLTDQFKALRKTAQADPDLLLAWHWLSTQHAADAGFGLFFTAVRRLPRPAAPQALQAIERLLDGKACQRHGRGIAAQAAQCAWPLAYTGSCQGSCRLK